MSDTPRTDAHSEAMEREDFDVELAKTYTFARQLERELAAATSKEPCLWSCDEDGNWDTACGQCMVFEYGPPKAQGYKFCSHCGKPVEFKEYTEPEIEEEP